MENPSYWDLVGPYAKEPQTGLKHSLYLGASCYAVSWCFQRDFDGYSLAVLLLSVLLTGIATKQFRSLLEGAVSPPASGLERLLGVLFLPLALATQLLAHLLVGAAGELIFWGVPGGIYLVFRAFAG